MAKQNSSASKAPAAPVSAKSHPYHHGSLPDALMHAAETVLRRDGMRGLTLRAIAREAGVSHTAPQHHFGDTSGVLSELAASGNRRMAESMVSHAKRARTGKTRRKALARGYVDFAVNNPDLFRLMSRSELLDSTRPSLIEARQQTARVLAGIFDHATAQESAAQHVMFSSMSGAQAASITAAWSFVHGLASLLIDGRLNVLATSASAFADAHALVDAVIEKTEMITELQVARDSNA